MALADTQTPEQLAIVDQAVLQNAFKQGFQMCGNALGAVRNTINAVKARSNPNSEGLVAESEALLAQLITTFDDVKTSAGFAPAPPENPPA